MGNAQAGGNLAQCCCESRTDASGMQNTVLLAKSPVKEAENLHGVGLVFRTTRDGKMVVSSFVKDSSAYECGLVRDGGGCLHAPAGRSLCVHSRSVHARGIPSCTRTMWLSWCSELLLSTSLGPIRARARARTYMRPLEIASGIFFKKVRTSNMPPAMCGAIASI
jgi:hypothetical protein